MRKVFILYENFYTSDGQKASIGGIQTYIKMLVKLIKEINMIPIIFQYGDIDFENIYDGVNVYGIATKCSWSKEKKNQNLFNKCKQQFDPENDIIIFACETMSVKNNYAKVIGIQHGVTWDVRGHEHYSHQKNLLFVFWRAIKAYKTVKRLKNVKFLVGVDYNFLNWYRSQVAYIETNVIVIPNSTAISELNTKPNNTLNIIFARRFQKYRGTKLFASVSKLILQKYDNVRITYAGSGPDEEYLKKLFHNNRKVNFINYDSDKSLEIHAQYQIAVVPTIGSEGTSLSLLEAMAAGCAIVATNVGGITNIILDNYNGLLRNPVEREIYDAIERLIIDKELREKLGENAHNTVQHSFNIELWKKKWHDIFVEVSGK